MPYLTFADYQERSSFEASETTEFFSRFGRLGTFAKWEKGLRTRKIDDKLRRRYAVPFGVVPPATEPDPALVPDAVKDWLTAYLDARLMRARRDPGAEVDAGDSDSTLEAREATQEIENAANANEPGHSELPLAADKPESSGVEKGGPFSIEFATPLDYWDSRVASRDC
jgi:hypothetical protein